MAKDARSQVGNLLYRSIAERWRPDDVAALLLEQPPVEWSEAEQALLQKAARDAYYGTARWERFGAKGFQKHQVSLAVLDRLSVLQEVSRTENQTDDIESAILVLRARLKCPKSKGSSFRHDRMNTKARKRAKLGLSRRQYAKLFRTLRALLRKQGRIVERGPLVRMLQIAKSGLAVTVPPKAVSGCPMAAAFVAYYAARKQRQSVFSNKGQSAAWDQVSDALFRRLRRFKRVPWSSVALAAPFPDVLKACSSKARVTFLAKVYGELLAAARVLAKLWADLGADRETMVVARGMNSSDWNAAAGAWNQLRGAWLNALYACGREKDLRRFCPGKAMRLMAADVAAWHRASGGEIDPNTKVFGALPLPWGVVLGTVRCTAKAVEQACLGAGLDPNKSGWLAAKPKQDPVETKPTPALVHGVAVGNPALADLLRRAGWFAGGGRPAKTVAGVEVKRDKHGAAVGVKCVKSKSKSKSKTTRRA